MPDPLLPLLPGPQDADRPWLVCYGIDERVELTGHVLSMWLAKIAGFVTSESAPGDGVHLGLPPHWRSVAWACGTWLAGRSVLVGSSAEICAARLTPVGTTADSVCLRDLASEGAAPAAPGTPAATVPSGERPTALTRAQLAARVEAAGTSVGADNRSASRAVLVRSPDTAQMLQEVLVAWRAGRTAVVLTPEADDDVAAAAIRQEGITEGTDRTQSR